MGGSDEGEESGGLSRPIKELHDKKLRPWTNHNLFLPRIHPGPTCVLII